MALYRSLHDHIMREAVACGRMKPKDMPMAETLTERLRAASDTCKLRIGTYRSLCGDAAAQIDRLQDAKRRALKIADERSKENVALRAAISAAQAKGFAEGVGAVVQKISTLEGPLLSKGAIAFLLDVIRALRPSAAPAISKDAHMDCYQYGTTSASEPAGALPRLTSEQLVELERRLIAAETEDADQLGQRVMLRGPARKEIDFRSTEYIHRLLEDVKVYRAELAGAPSEEDVARLLKAVRHVLDDFDAPVCHPMATHVSVDAITDLRVAYVALYQRGKNEQAD